MGKSNECSFGRITSLIWECPHPEVSHFPKMNKAQKEEKELATMGIEEKH
jgi:hypothetical protein